MTYVLMLNEVLFSFPSRENGNSAKVAFVTDMGEYTVCDIPGTNTLCREYLPGLS